MEVSFGKNIFLDVRQATVSDARWITRFLWLLNKSSKSKSSLFVSRDFVFETVKDFIENKIALIATDNGRPIGFLGGIVGAHNLNPAIRTSTKVAMGVNPKYLNLGVTEMLIRFYNDVCKHIGVNMVFVRMPFESTISHAEMQDMGFRLAEKEFIAEYSS